MKTFRQLLSGLFAGAIVLVLVSGSLVLSAGDAVSPNTLGVATTLPLPPSLTSAPPSATPTLIPTTTACSRPPGWIDYIVVAGDDLNSIAARLGLEALALQTANCLSDNIVNAGQNLFVPPPTPTPTTTATAIPGQTPIVIPPTLCGPPFGWAIYTVRPGDTLFSIANATGTTVQQLMFANCLDTTQIRIGQRLFVPRLPFVSATPSRTPIPPSATPSATPSPTSPTSTPSPITDTPTATNTFPVPTTEVSTPTDTPVPSDTDTPIQSPTPSPTVDLPPSDTSTEPPSATP